MKAITRIIAIACFPALALAQVGLQPDKIAPSIESLETGVVCAPLAIGEAPAPGTVAGTTHIIGVEPPFVSTSRRVPAVLGIGFGVKSMAESGEGIEDVTMVVTHPPMGDGQVQTQSFGTRISGLDPSLTFYQFDFEYELVFGVWQMTAMKDGEVLYTASFEVLPPSKVPELAAICGYENLLS